LSSDTFVDVVTRLNALYVLFETPQQNLETEPESLQQEEGETESKLYEKYQCFCKKGSGDLDSSISAAETKIPAVSSDLEAAEAKMAETKGDLKAAQDDRSAAKAAVAEATAIREKEAASFAAEKAEYGSNIDAIKQAVAALGRGMAGTFLQTRAAQVLRRLAGSKHDVMLDVDRQQLLSFLSAGEGSNYSPQSGEVTGMLKQMGDEMAKGLSEATAAEEAAIAAYEALMAAKAKELQALTASIQAKLTLISELGVKIAQMKEDLSDTEEALAEDRKFLAELKKGCETKKAEWEERSKTRADELLALAETIKLLNDDDALELFKKTLPSPSPSFVQVKTSASATRSRALAAIRAARRGAGRQERAALDLLVLALAGKKALTQGGFDKVIGMCDAMVETLKKEQQRDDRKKVFCMRELDLSDDKRKALERGVADEERAIAAAEEDIAKLTEEIEALGAAIASLDKSVAEATEQRKAENAEFRDLMASNTAAKELLNLAKNRLAKFYNPRLYKAPAKVELSAEDRIVANMKGGAVLAQIAAHAQSKDAPATPPATWDAYAKKSEGHQGVVALVNLLIKELDKEMTEGETEEKDAQADYVQMMEDSAEKRASDAKSLSDKEAARADLKVALEAHKDAKASTSKELAATMQYIHMLHGSCDWLLQYFDARRSARASEIDSLKKAKAVLSGADYSLLQVRARAFLAH